MGFVIISIQPDIRVQLVVALLLIIYDFCFLSVLVS